MGNHYAVLEVAGICPKTGYPMSKDGHLLCTFDSDGSVVKDWGVMNNKLVCFTDPYGSLEYAYGSEDDFHCFDYALIHAGPRGEFIILDSTINSETGCFIMGGSYAVLPVNTQKEKEYAVSFAEGIVDLAVQWCFDNEVRPSKRGWNQDHRYFVRKVAEELFEYRFYDFKKRESRFSGRQFRFGGKTIDAIVDECMCTQGIFSDVLGASL